MRHPDSLEHLVETGARWLANLSDGVTAVALGGVAILIAWSVPGIVNIFGVM